MKKRMRLLITCMTFIIMSTFAVNATEVSSGNAGTVSGNATVSGGDASWYAPYINADATQFMYRSLYGGDIKGFGYINNQYSYIFLTATDVQNNFNVKNPKYESEEGVQISAEGEMIPCTIDLSNLGSAFDALSAYVVESPGDKASAVFTDYIPRDRGYALIRNNVDKAVYFVMIDYAKLRAVDVKGNEGFDTSINLKVTHSNDNDTSAKITALFSVSDEFYFFNPSGAKFSSIDLLKDGKIIKSYHLSNGNTKEFKVKSNGRYKVRVFVASGIYAEEEVLISGLSNDTDHSSGEESDDKYEEIKIDRTAPSITFSALPTSAYKGSPLSITIYTDEPAKISMNGKTSQGYVTEFVVTVSGNGTYTCIASDEQGNSSTAKLDVDIFTETNVFDEASRDNAWGDTVNQKLPQTGTIGLLGVALLCGCGAGVGVYCIKKSRKNGGKSDEDE